MSTFNPEELLKLPTFYFPVASPTLSAPVQIMPVPQPSNPVDTRPPSQRFGGRLSMPPKSTGGG